MILSGRYIYTNNREIINYSIENIKRRKVGKFS
nr:MAG TPA: hypothetical protein [Caudoviricetes sp.]DAV59429.1 MAG TPA: hypothetical protein [Caudoviricetes sp.]DAW77474.1 MAG TPA: hypothetical protein [Caudoviricetes sp.]DAW81758.1 MAG TPA: hypothetical protein [Caudoviricetes sp.]